MAYIIEEAGGMAVNGKIPLLDIQPIELHQRTPVLQKLSYKKDLTLILFKYNQPVLMFSTIIVII